MLPSQKRILDVLKNKPASSEELTMITELSPDGIRGRISEIRKLGYEINKVDGKYRLDEDRLTAEKLLSYVESNKLYGQKIKVSMLMNELDMSHEKLTDILSKLYHRKQLLQVTKDVVIIYNI